MEKVTNHLLETPHSEAKQKQFQDEKFRKFIEQKFAAKEYPDAYKQNYQITLAVTYPLQVLMIATGLTGLTLIVGSMIGYELSMNTISQPIAIFAILLSTTLLVGLEWAKRSFGEKAFEVAYEKNKLKLFVPVALLMLISIGLSFYGSFHIVKSVGGGNVELIDIKAINAHYTPLLAQSERNLDGFRNRKGEFYHKYSKQVSAEQALLTSLRTEYQQKLNAAETNNAGQTASSIASLEKKAWSIGYVSLFCELLFLICIGSKEKYEYKCAIHFLGEVNQEAESGGLKKGKQLYMRPTNQKLQTAESRPVIQGFRRHESVVSPPLFSGGESHEMVLETAVPQHLQPESVSDSKTDSRTDTEVRITTADVSDIKRRISTLNARIRPKTEGNKSGYVSEAAKKRRLLKLEEAISELELHGITAIINYEKHESVKYQKLS